MQKASSMKLINRISNQVSIMALLVAAGCVAPGASAGFSSGTYATGPGPAPGPRSTALVVEPAYAPGEDAHWFRDDDYLISNRPYEGRALRSLQVAKMTAVATAQTKTEARFLTSDGRELWTASFWQSRVATREDLVLGALAMCPYTGAREVEAPRDKHRARQRRWMIGVISDDADLYKGRITVGDTSCAVDAVRVPLR